MNKLSLVKTFGGAVTYLSDEYNDFDISVHRQDILKRIKDDPRDIITKTAWETFLRGTRKNRKESVIQKPRIIYFWKASDIETGEQYEAISAFELAQQLNVSESVVANCRRENRMVQKRYKITRKKA